MLQNLDAYKLKWIAIIGMVLSHMVYAWHDIMPLWLMIPMMASGGLTYPIMGYFVVEGYKHTSNIKLYLLRLFAFGLIAIPFYPLVFGTFQLNIMFSIMLSLIMFMLYDKVNKQFLFWLLLFPLFLIASLFVDWWIFGLIMMILYYTISNEKARRIVPALVGSGLFTGYIWFGMSTLSRFLSTPGMETHAEAFIAQYGDMDYLISCMFMIVGSICAVLLLKNYNGERGKRAKWLFYVAYPLHLIIIGGIALVLGLTDFYWF